MHLTVRKYKESTSIGGSMKTGFIFGVLILFLTAAPLPAQTSFTVDQAVAAAMNNNSSILQDSVKLEGLKRKKNKSLNGLSPSLSAGAGVVYPNDPSAYDHTAYWMANVTFSFSATVASDVMKARISYEEGLITRETLLKNIELAVRKSFYGLLYGKINIELQKRNLESAQTRYEQTLAKFKAGRISEIDVLSSKVTREKLKPQLAAAQTQWYNDMASFKQLIGVQQKDDIVLEGSLDEVLELREIILEGAAARSAEVRSMEKSLELAKAVKTEAQFSAYSPRFSLGYTYQPSRGYEPVDPAIPGSDWNDEGSLTAAVTVPLDGVLPWSDSGENISSAHDSVKILEMQLEEARTSSAIKVESLLRKIAQSQSTIKALRENVELAEQSYNIMSEAYKYGTKDLLSVEDSADSLFQAEAALMSEAYTLISSILDLENLIGAPFGSLGK